MGPFYYFQNISRGIAILSHVLTPEKVKEDFNSQFVSTNKQYVKIKLMQNETNRWEYFYGKDEILVKLWSEGLNYHNFHIFDYN